MQYGRQDACSIRHICDAQQRESSINAEPEDNITEQLVAFDSWDPPDSNQRELNQLQKRRD